MIPGPPARAGVPSRRTLRVLRRLALAGSTLGVIGGACTVAALSYEIQRRIHIAERLVENKRALQTACTKYNSSARISSLAKMVEAAEAGDFNGMESMKAAVDKTTTPTDGDIRERGRKGNNIVRTDEDGQTLWTSGFPADQQLRRSDISAIGSLPPNPNSLQTRPPAEAYQEMERLRLRPRPSKFKDSLSLVQKSLDDGDPVKATDQLLNETSPEDMTETHHALGVKLFYINIEQGNIPLALTIFRWIEHFFTITPALWVAILEPLCKRRNLAAISEIYRQYSTEFRLPYRLRGRVVKALVMSYQFREAKETTLAYLEDDTCCSMCAGYLNTLRKKSRDDELVETQFRSILLSFSRLGMRVTEKLFNPLLKTYIESGQYEKAQSLVHEMETSFGINLGVKTLGPIALGKALQGEWEAVDKVFQEIKAVETTEMDTKVFVHVFDRIFLEYFLSHPGRKIRDFVFRAIDDYGLIPDKCLFEHILMAYIQKGNSGMVTELMETAENRQWDVRLEKEYFMNCVRSHRMSLEAGGRGLWRMFVAGQQKFGRLSASNRVLDFEKSSFPHEEAYKFPGSGEETRSLRKAVSVSQPTKPIDNYSSLRKRMVHFMHTGKRGPAVELYWDAKRAGKVIKQVHVKLAVIASVAHHGNLDEAKAILEKERDALFKPEVKSTPRIFRTILEGGDARMAGLIDVFYWTLEAEGMPIKHDMLTSLSARLTYLGKAGHAIPLIRRVNRSKYVVQAPFCVPMLKIIARACAIVGNLGGVRWAILTALNRISHKRRDGVDQDLIVEIETIIARLQSRSKTGSFRRARQLEKETKSLVFLAQCLKRAIRFSQSRNLQSVTSPRQQMPADIEEVSPMRWVADAAAIRVESGKKPISAPSVLSYRSIREILKDWDEREELEKALTQSPIWMGSPGPEGDVSPDLFSG